MRTGKLKMFFFSFAKKRKIEYVQGEDNDTLLNNERVTFRGHSKKSKFEQGRVQGEEMSQLNYGNVVVWIIVSIGEKDFFLKKERYACVVLRIRLGKMPKQT